MDGIFMQESIDTIVTRRFLNCLRGIGKTHGMIENVKTCIDDLLLYKNEFEVLIICASVEDKRNLRRVFTDYYAKYVDIKTMSDLFYKLSEFPINDEDPYDVPRLDKCHWAFNGKHYERFFIDASCYERICLQYLDKLDKIKEICL